MPGFRVLRACALSAGFDSVPRKMVPGVTRPKGFSEIYFARMILYARVTSGGKYGSKALFQRRDLRHAVLGARSFSYTSYAGSPGTCHDFRARRAERCNLKCQAARSDRGGPTDFSPRQQIGGQRKEAQRLFMLRSNFSPCARGSVFWASASPTSPGTKKGGFRRPFLQDLLFNYSDRHRRNARSMRA